MNDKTAANGTLRWLEGSRATMLTIRAAGARLCRTLPVAAAMLLACHAQAAETQEIRSLNGAFTAIQMDAPLDLVLSQGATRGLVLQGDAEILARVKADVKDNQLVISMENKKGWDASWTTRSPLRATLSVPVLTRLAVHGSGDARMGRFDLKDGELSVEIKGSGDVVTEFFQAKSFKLAIQGSGDAQLEGIVERQSISIAGSGDCLAGKLKSRTANVSIAGSGDIQIWTEESLAVSIAGSGDVSYYGQPKVTQSIRGSGDLISLGMK